ncbi:MAG: hypothetical protein QOI74_2546, partial [Micromonosporaceae bacterium]|nr:hypothetical protein [Micromonosporaceae bacterium]
MLTIAAGPVIGSAVRVTTGRATGVTVGFGLMVSVMARLLVYQTESVYCAVNVARPGPVGVPVTSPSDIVNPCGRLPRVTAHVPSSMSVVCNRSMYLSPTTPSASVGELTIGRALVTGGPAETYSSLSGDPVPRSV